MEGKSVMYKQQGLKREVHSRVWGRKKKSIDNSWSLF